MPAIRAGSCTASPVANAGGGVAAHLVNRVRSASPSRRALAIDMRRIASLLRDPPVATGGDGSVNTSICSSPHSAWEPGDRGAAPMGANNAAARVGNLSQVSVLVEKVYAAVASVRSQCDADRRRINQLERKVEAQLDERVGSTDGREKWAETQGKVNGLEEETQALSRRLDKCIESLDKRIWDRTSGSEGKCRSLEQQLQALEQQSRHSSTTGEEVQKRQAAKLRRTEHSIEELSRRLLKAEEDLRMQGQGSQGYIEQKFSILEQNQEQLSFDLQHLQEQLDEGLQAIGENPGGEDDVAGENQHSIFALDEAVQAAERGLAALEKKLGPQIEDLAASLASLRVKADGQFHRVASLTERLETAHEPAIESMRAEMAQARTQERRELEGEIAVLRQRVQEVADAAEDSNAEVREASRQARAEIAAISLRPEENPMIRAIEERLGAQEQEVMDLRDMCDSLASSQGGMERREANEHGPEGWQVQAGSLEPALDLEDTRRRLEWLEEQSTAGAASSGNVDQRQIQQVQNTICDLVEQVSNIKQRSSSAEASSATLQQQVQQLQERTERRCNDESSSGRGVSEVEAKVGAVSQQVADIAARLLEVEGDREFARENDPLPGVEVSAVSVASEVGSNLNARGLPPLPRGEVERERTEAAGRSNDLQQQLMAVASHLEAMDELAERVADLEQRQNVGGSGLGAAAEDQVSFGPVAHSSSDAVSKEVDNLSVEVTEMRGRLMAAERLLEKLPEAPIADEMKSVADRVTQLEADSGPQSPAKATTAELNVIQERMVKLEAASNASSGFSDDLKLFNERMAKLEAASASSGFSDDLKLFNERMAGLEAASSSHSGFSDDLKSFHERVVKLESASSSQSTSNSFADELKTVHDRVLKLEGDLSAQITDGAETSAKRHEQVRQDVINVQELYEKLNSKTNGDFEADMKALTQKQQDGAAVTEGCISSMETFMEKTNGRLASIEGAAKDYEKESRCEIESLTKKLNTVAEKTEQPPPSSSSGDLAGIRKEVADLATKVSEAQAGIQELREDAARAPTSPATGASGSTPSAADERARAQVQTQVEELRRQVLDELGGLSEHQAELSGAKDMLKALADKVASKESSGSDQQEDAEARKRLGVLEAASEALRKDLTELDDGCGEIQKQVADLRAKVQEQQQPAPQAVRKIGISMSSPGEETASSPIAFVRNKLDLLSEQVADLQCKVAQGAGSNGTTARGGEQSRDASINGATADQDVDFSFTADQTGAGPGGSLNFSLTEQRPTGSRGNSHGNSPCSSGGSEPSSPKGRGNDQPSVGIGGKCGGGDTLDDLLEDVIGGGSKKKPSDSADNNSGTPTDARPRPSPLTFDEDKSATAGQLPSVAEEESVDLQDEEAAKQASASGGASASAGPAGVLRSAASVTPKSTRSSVESPGGGGLLEVSQSGNEVSIGCDVDISVEDSLQLEDECDHVENVKPNPRALERTAALSPDAAAGGKALSTSSQSPVAAAGKSPAAASQSSKSAAAANGASLSVKSPAAASLSSKSPASESAKSPLSASLSSKSPVAAAAKSLAAASEPSKSPPAAASKASVGLAGTAASASENRPAISPKSATKDDDERYDDSFDDDDMSVPESIDESPDNSGSGGWGAGAEA